MAVINTNYLALVSQNNLNKSQSSLGQAIERLSSGLRINSAKDDAAGQAIANRFTANITGLSQASRNANDGISIAQTTEGSLNEINNNLQRIRQLAVQAANGSNSSSDLQSIQDEINQRMAEIDRVSAQTQFNGKRVLAEDGALKVQVGANDSETIDVSLRKINSDTLGISPLNMNNQLVSVDANGNQNFKTVSVVNTNFAPSQITSVGPFKAAEAPKWTDLTFKVSGGMAFQGFAATSASNALVAHFSGGGVSAYYEATYNASTGQVTVNFGASVAAAGINSGATHFDYNDSSIGGIIEISALNGISPKIDINVTQVFMLNSAVGASTLFQVAASVNGATKYYNASLASNGVMNVNMATSIAAASTGISVTVENILSTVAVAAVQYTINGAPSGGSGRLVRAGDGNTYLEHTISGKTSYYAATLSNSIATVSATAVNITPNMTTVNSAYAGSNVLVQYGGNSGAHYVKNVNNGETKYYAATLSSTGNVTVAASGAQVVVDPLAAIDKALQQVDNLRSELGAVQNRFESTIANLANTVANLSAARSRIEDADYAVEVSNMTRAQILQQAGTAVLAQANQVPQTMLSLLR